MLMGVRNEQKKLKLISKSQTNLKEAKHENQCMNSKFKIQNHQNRMSNSFQKSKELIPKSRTSFQTKEAQFQINIVHF